MATLYTDGSYFTLSASQLNSYSLIRYSATDLTSSVMLGLTSSGSVNLSAKLGTVSALLDCWTGNDNIIMGAGNDTVWGNSGSDVLTGGLGDDLLIGDWGTADRIGNDTLYGGDGSDELIGGPGTDALYGGNGDDYFSIAEALPGLDGIFGGTGIDAISIRDVFSVYVPTVSFSRLAFGVANSIEYLLWDNPGTAITGTSGSNLFDLSNLEVLRWNGSSYEQRFEVDLLAGNDTFIGGEGDEHVTIIGAGDRITLGDGNDTLTVVDAALAGSIISAGAGYDTLELGGPYLDAQNDRIIALSVLNSVATLGFERVVIGAKIQLTGTALADVRDLAGLDFGMTASYKPIMLLEGDDHIFGATGNFYADGGAGNDTIVSGAGDDVLQGWTGSDFLAGGEGSDQYIVDRVDDVIVDDGLVGIDTVFASLRKFRLGDAFENLYLGGTDATAIGNAKDNLIQTGSGSDSVRALGGNDTLDSYQGLDTLVGGQGDDLYRIGSNRAKIVELAGEGVDTVATYRTVYRLGDGVENLTYLGQERFAGTGNAAANILTGGSLKDTLNGSGGNDSLHGGTGNDSLYGGSGDDSYWVDAAGDVIFETGSGRDTVYSAVSFGLPEGTEVLYLLPEATDFFWVSASGNAADNLIVGSGRTAALGGGAGNDTLIGGAANDSLYGGDGNDVLLGDGLSARCYGGAGDDLYIVQGDDYVLENSGGGDPGGTDTIQTSDDWLSTGNSIENVINSYNAGGVNSAGSSNQGGTGNNHLTTGEGADTLYGQTGQDTLTGGLGDDLYGVFVEGWTAAFATIEGFSSGHDRVALFSDNRVSLTQAGSLAGDLFKVIGSGQAVDGNDRVLYDEVTGTLYLDADGSGVIAARAIAQIEGHPVLTAADFTVVLDTWGF